MNATITFAVCDDHTLFRKTLIATLLNFKQLSLLTEAQNGKELIFKISTNPPHIIIVDIRMPGMDGYETITYLKQHFPDTKIIALSGYDNEYAINMVLEKGADTFISKNDEPEDMYLAITDVYEKGFHINKWVREAKRKLKHLPKLTLKENEIFQFLCRDLTYGQIAEQLNISIKTVDRHRDEIFRKFNVNSRTSLIIFSLNNGLTGSAL
ncbi:MAG: response regulator transcription factor [Bacteroidota bacterium]|nr:response regulator transcription factor [Bacteroidota bacterium]